MKKKLDKYIVLTGMILNALLMFGWQYASTWYYDKIAYILSLMYLIVFLILFIVWVIAMVYMKKNQLALNSKFNIYCSIGVIAFECVTHAFNLHALLTNSLAFIFSVVVIISTLLLGHE